MPVVNELMLATFRNARSRHCQSKKEHLLPESESNNDHSPNNGSTSQTRHNGNVIWHQPSRFAADGVDEDVNVEYELTDASGRIKSVVNTLPPQQQQQHQQQPDTYFEEQEVYLLHGGVPETSPEQQSFEDSLLLEQRTHYESVRWLGCLTLVIVLAVGGIMMTLDHEIHLRSSTGSSLHVSHFLVLAVVCCPPLWLVWEGHVQNQQLDQVIGNTPENKTDLRQYKKSQA